jgi:hypothetical protein
MEPEKTGRFVYLPVDIGKALFKEREELKNKRNAQKSSFASEELVVKNTQKDLNDSKSRDDSIKSKVIQIGMNIISNSTVEASAVKSLSQGRDGEVTSNALQTNTNIVEENKNLSSFAKQVGNSLVESVSMNKGKTNMVQSNEKVDAKNHSPVKGVAFSANSIDVEVTAPISGQCSPKKIDVHIYTEKGVIDIPSPNKPVDSRLKSPNKEGIQSIPSKLLVNELPKKESIKPSKDSENPVDSVQQSPRKLESNLNMNTLKLQGLNVPKMKHESVISPPKQPDWQPESKNELDTKSSAIQEKSQTLKNNESHSADPNIKFNNEDLSNAQSGTLISPNTSPNLQKITLNPIVQSSQIDSTMSLFITENSKSSNPIQSDDKLSNNQPASPMKHDQTILPLDSKNVLSEKRSLLELVEKQVKKVKLKDHRFLSPHSSKPLINSSKIVEDNIKAYQTPATEQTIVQFIYPSGVSEEFNLLFPKADDYNPIQDIYKTVQLIANYIPDLGTEKNGILRKIIKYSNLKNIDNLKEAIHEYNQVISNYTPADLDIAPTADYELIHHILEQSYSRSIAPNAQLLNNYIGFSNNVYGEIKHTFVNEIINTAKIIPSDVFLDLGSGIGNVVLQVAGQVLCESYGIEIMENPSTFAKRQRIEFVSRLKAYNRPCGKILLKQGDFLKDESVPMIIKKADVIFVNK